MNGKLIVLIILVIVFAVSYQWISNNTTYILWKLWELYIWSGYYGFLFHFKYVAPPRDGLNLSAEFHSLEISTTVHRLLFPAPIDENEWLDYFKWVTNDAMAVYMPINPSCSILPSSFISSSNNKPALWIIGDKLISNLNKYNSTNSLTILMIHGGAFVIGSAAGKTYVGIACHLSNYLKMRILFVDYELTPQYSMPTPINSIFDAYMFLLNDVKVNANNILLHGDSAGGILTIWTLQRILKNNVNQPKGAILISPHLDISCSTNSWMHKFNNFDAIAKRDNVYRNVLWLMSNNTQMLMENRIENVDLNGLNTKFFVYIGKNEVLYEEVMNWKEVCLNKFNIEWNEIIIEYGLHDHPLLIGLFPEAEEIMLQIAEFIHNRWLNI